MGTIHSPRSSHLVLLFCVAISCLAGAFAPAASAGPLEGVTGPVGEIVGEPVREVVETIKPPVEEVTEAATAPVQEVTEAPPVKEVTETVTAPVETVTKEVAPPAKAVTPPVKAAVESVTHPSASPVKAPSVGSVTSKAKGATQAPKEAVDHVVESSSPATSRTARSTGTATATPADAGASEAELAETTARSAPASPGTDRAGAPRGTVFVPSPGRDGSTAAPLPKWMSYIWPAIALARPELARLLEGSESALRVALGTAAAGSSSGEQGVAGVDASSGRSGSAGAPAHSPSHSSSSPFSKITSAVGHFPYNVSGAALGYIAIVAVMLIALFIAVRWEIANGRREGRG